MHNHKAKPPPVRRKKVTYSAKKVQLEFLQKDSQRADLL